MDYQVTAQDIEFMKWLDSKECEHYWEKDDKREKVILKNSLDKEQEEYNRTKQLADRKTVFYNETSIAFVFILRKSLTTCQIDFEPKFFFLPEMRGFPKTNIYYGSEIIWKFYNLDEQAARQLKLKS